MHKILSKFTSEELLKRYVELCETAVEKFFKGEMGATETRAFVSLISGFLLAAGARATIAEKEAKLIEFKEERNG